MTNNGNYETKDGQDISSVEQLYREKINTGKFIPDSKWWFFKNVYSNMIYIKRGQKYIEVYEKAIRFLGTTLYHEKGTNQYYDKNGSDAIVQRHLPYKYNV